MKNKEKTGIVLCSNPAKNPLSKAIKEKAFIEIDPNRTAKIKILGFFATSDSMNNDHSYLGKFRDINSFIEKNQIDFIFIILTNDRDKKKLLRYLDYRLLKKSKMYIESTTEDWWNFSLKGIHCVNIENLSFFYLNYQSHYFFLKKYTDKVLAFIMIFFLLPLFIFLFFTIKILSPGPVIFKQTRVGQNGQFFIIYKFRTMNMGNDTPYQVKKNDSRLTKIGHFLRIVRLDELPQLFNVLKGDMFLIGPRPLVTAEIEEISKKNPLFKWRHLVKPGITGLAQVSGNYYTKLEEKLNYDLLYIFNYSLPREIMISAKTVKTLLLAKGN